MREYLFQLLESGGGELTGEVILLRLCGEAFSAKHRAKFSEKLLSIHLVLPPES